VADLKKKGATGGSPYAICQTSVGRTYKGNKATASLKRLHKAWVKGIKKRSK
jgi:hypothetical protein